MAIEIRNILLTDVCKQKVTDKTLNTVLCYVTGFTD